MWLKKMTYAVTGEGGNPLLCIAKETEERESEGPNSKWGRTPSAENFKQHLERCKEFMCEAHRGEEAYYMWGLILSTINKQTSDLEYLTILQSWYFYRWRLRAFVGEIPSIEGFGILRD